MTWHPDIPPEFRDQIVTGDARELAARLPDESVDLIFTDPPWSPDVVDLFGWLGTEARRVLRPGGFLLTFCGKNRLDLVMAQLSRNLSFYWPICGYQPQSNLVFNPRRILEKWRPALLYSKGYEPKRSAFIPDLLPTDRDKRFHEWGQGETFWRFYAEKLGGGVIWEPFCGGGTVPAICKSLGSGWIAFELDPETALLARERVRLTPLPLLLPEPEPPLTLDFAEVPG